jgi:hypothetical protein
MGVPSYVRDVEHCDIFIVYVYVFAYNLLICLSNSYI